MNSRTWSPPLWRHPTLAATLLALSCLSACATEDPADVAASQADDATSGTDTAITPDVEADVDAGAVVDADAGSEEDAGRAPTPEWDAFQPGPPPIPRLTQTQLRNVYRALLGDDIIIPPINLPDVREVGLLSVGAGGATVSPRSAEDLERAALELARQAVSPERRERLGDCTPEASRDDACATQLLESLASRAWRRPVLAEELQPLVALAGEAAETYDDFWEGLKWPISAILQSPHLLFRREVGELGEDGVRRYTSFEMAARLSFLLWNTMPDEALREAAASGELATDAGIQAQVDRMLADERAREGILEFFRQIYGLEELRNLSKDPTVFPAMSPELGPAALEETEEFLWSIIQEDQDFHNLLLSNRTYIDRRLAALYGVPAPDPEAFGWVELPETTGRRGLLGQASFLLLNAHPTSTSATLRGKFIRERILCLPVPPPPSNIDTSIPEPDANARTLRERMQVHQEDPTCAGCHALTDPMGLTFETYDGLGMFRTTENGAPIITADVLEGDFFADAWELADVLAQREEFQECVVQNFLRYANSKVEIRGQRSAVIILTHAFEDSGYRFRSLISSLALSPAFRTVGEITDLEATP